MSDETKPQDDAAMSPASVGSQPVAWRAYAEDGSETVYLFYEHARAEADEWNWSVEPLYRQPQPTLTDAEREAVERAVAFCECTNAPLPTSDQIATLRSLLEQTKEVSDE